MNKRLLKRHKRQVSRAKERVKLSEPDLRTPEQISAAREAGRQSSGRRGESNTHYSAPPIQGKASTALHSSAKPDG